jgi:hypothetical protein
MLILFITLAVVFRVATLLISISNRATTKEPGTKVFRWLSGCQFRARHGLGFQTMYRHGADL